MYNNSRVDKFGNEYQLVGCRDKSGRGYAKGYIKIGTVLYKLEPSPAKKDGVMYWIRVTKMRPRSSSRGF